MKIPFLDLVTEYQEIKTEIDSAIQRVLDSGKYILGEEVYQFENEVSRYLDVGHCVGVASGTDALILSLRALEIGPGDEVILPAYTFFATLSAVLHVGAKPVLVDIDPQSFCLDTTQVARAITDRTRAVIPVHLYGHPADMDALRVIAEKGNLKIIEDNAQAFGSEYRGRKTGSIGDLACLSFFPTKNLGGYGDGGMVATSSADLAEKIRTLRTHGWKDKYYPEVLGYNSRLDTLQAAVLRVKLGHLDRWNHRRREIAKNLTERLAGTKLVQTPVEQAYAKHIYHLYVLRSPDRDQLADNLSRAGISTGIYYPQPVHLSKPVQGYGYRPNDFPVSEKACLETLAVPLFPSITADQIDYLVTSIQGSLLEK